MNSVPEIRKWLSTRRQSHVDLRDSLRLWRVIYIVATVVFLAGAWLVTSQSADGVRWENVTFVAIFVLALLVAFYMTRARIIEMNLELRVIEYEILLIGLNDKRARTAASLFFKHQTELKRYYDQNLRQNNHVFILGIFCVLTGLGTVFAALHMLTREETSQGIEIAVGILGAVGALLSGAVATIFISMHSNSSDALREFHHRLAFTNRLHFANLIASETPNKYEDLVDEIVKGAVSNPAPATE